jgi:hypothetical protein
LQNPSFIHYAEPEVGKGKRLLSMMSHNVDFVGENGKWRAKCSSFDLNEEYDTRDEAFLACHMHIALAGKEDHD